MSQSLAMSADTTVTASLNYIVDTGVKPVNETGGRDGLTRTTTGKFVRHQVAIHDGRAPGASFSLDGNGFELVPHPTRIKDFFDKNELRGAYYEEMVRLIAERSGAKRVHVFDHTLRSSSEEVRDEKKIREPVKSVHNDYTEWSGPQRVRDILPDEAETLLSRRFAIVQTWRAIGKTIERDPLTLADSRTLEAGDFVAAERRFPDRVGEIYQFQYNPKHRWTYFPHMHRDEALVFKVYDSALDGRARWSAHTSFDDPATPQGAPPRESIEIRAFAFF